MNDDTHDAIRRFIAGDAAAVLAAAAHCHDPAVLAAAALTLLQRARANATTTRDRQLVAITAAHLAGDHDLVAALASEHLSDHPDSLLVAWLANSPGTPAKEPR